VSVLLRWVCHSCRVGVLLMLGGVHVLLKGQPTVIPSMKYLLSRCRILWWNIFILEPSFFLLNTNNNNNNNNTNNNTGRYRQ
jgi:hypothetical protein